MSQSDNSSSGESLSQGKTHPIDALSDGEKGVIVQRDRATYAIAPNLPCGLVTPDMLRKIADVAERYGCAALKLTSAERIALIGLSAQDVDAAWNDLGMPHGGVTGEVVRSVKACPGTQYCKRGQQDSIAVGLLLDERYHGKAMPGKLKIGVSGCPNQCAETWFKDIGLVGTKPGWDLLVGGCGGSVPHIATRIAKGKSTEAVLELVGGIFEFYQSQARPKERLFRTLSRLGMDALLTHLRLEPIAQPSPHERPSVP